MISFEENGKKFNFRASAIILDNSGKKLLIHKTNNRDFWLLPGGRVEMQESTQDAIVRELKEELGITPREVKLALITENFFNLIDKPYHEVGFVFVVRLNRDDSLLKKEGLFEGIEGAKFLFKWYDIDKIKELDFRPPFYVKEIENIHKLTGIKHLVVDDKSVFLP